MKKSLLSLALAGSMLSALAVPAFAATPSDVVGKPVQTAVEALTALGIINGYADGTFKPDNTITRAELAKIVIVATGNESAANLMANTAPSFKDVKKGAWYTGYINAAAAKGFIQGYNGNFRPNDTIKFEEVTAILVRALGYKDKYLSGSWPYNVLLQADEVGLFSGVGMANGTNATRGTVAELAENALGANLVQYNADGDLSNVKVKDVEQLLINKLGTSTSEILDVTAVTDGKISFVSGDVAVADNFFITGGKKLTDLIGHSVTVLKNKDGKVLAVTDNQASTKIVSTTLKGDQVLNDGSLSTKASTTDYKVADKALLFVNTDPTDFDTKTYTDGTDVQLLLNAAGDVQAILVTKWIPDAQISDIVAYTNYSVINSSGGSFKVDATTSVTLDGKAATLADLKADDIIDVIKNKAGLATKVVATRSVVTGKVEATGKVGTDFTVKVGGKTYVAAFDSVTKLSLDAEYTFYLNKDSKAIAYKAATAATATDYYVVYTVATKGAPILIDNQLSTDDYYKIVYYSLKDSTKKVAYTKETAVVGALTDNSIAQLTFKDGYITEVKNPKQLADAKLAKVDSISGTRITLKDSTNATSTYVLDGNTVYLKVTDKDADSTVATLAASDVKVGDYVTVSNEGATAKFVVVTTQGSVAELPQVQGLFVNQSSVNSASGTAYYVTLNINNEEKTFAVEAPITGVNKYDVVTLVDKDSKNAYYETTGVSVANHKTLIANAPTVDASAKTITLAGVGGTTYVVTENTKFYNINADDTGLAVGYFNDVRVAADTVSGNYGTGKGQYQLVIVDGKDTYGNNFKEAGVVVVVYHN